MREFYSRCGVTGARVFLAALVGIPGVREREREEREERSKDRFHPMNTVREARDAEARMNAEQQN